MNGIAEATEREFSLMHSYQAICELRINDQPKKAVSLAEKSLGEARSQGLEFQANALNNLALICDNAGRFDDAEKYVAEAVAIYRELGLVTNDTLQLCKLHCTLLTQRKKYDEATELVQNLTQILNDNDLYWTSENAELMKIMAQIRTVMGDFRSAGFVLAEAARIYRNILSPEDYELAYQECSEQFEKQNEVLKILKAQFMQNRLSAG